jgi:hypothetical protein
MRINGLGQVLILSVAKAKGSHQERTLETKRSRVVKNEGTLSIKQAKGTRSKETHAFNTSHDQLKHRMYAIFPKISSVSIRVNFFIFTDTSDDTIQRLILNKTFTEVNSFDISVCLIYIVYQSIFRVCSDFIITCVSTSRQSQNSKECINDTRHVSHLCLILF